MNYLTPEETKKRRAQFTRRRKALVAQVLERDGCACKKCGVQTIDFNSLFRMYGHYDGERWTMNNSREYPLQTIDHIVPIVEGGTDELENLRILCAPCNTPRTNYRLERESQNPYRNK